MSSCEVDSFVMDVLCNLILGGHSVGLSADCKRDEMCNNDVEEGGTGWNM